MDASMEAELMDYSNCMICKWWTCCNDRDHRRWLVGIACM